jgi:hypothetical protein
MITKNLYLETFVFLQLEEDKVYLFQEDCSSIVQNMLNERFPGHWILQLFYQTITVKKKKEEKSSA